MPVRSMSFDETWKNQANTGWACIKKKNHWEFRIPDICQDGVNTLPPSKSARPSITLKKFEGIHLAETVPFAGRPEWKPVQLTLFDVKKKNAHPIYKWIEMFYDPFLGKCKFPCEPGFKKDAYLRHLDGCGEVLDLWTFQECWPEVTDFGELDYGDGGIVTVDITLNYTRAYYIN